MNWKWAKFLNIYFCFWTWICVYALLSYNYISNCNYPRSSNINVYRNRFTIFTVYYNKNCQKVQLSIYIFMLLQLEFVANLLNFNVPYQIKFDWIQFQNQINYSCEWTCHFDIKYLSFSKFSWKFFVFLRYFRRIFPFQIE